MLLSQLISKFARKDNISFKQHAVIRMLERGILADDVKDVLLKGEIIENYIDDYPFPSYLIFGTTKQNRPIHVVAAIDESKENIWIITVYEPDINQWEAGFKKRKET